MTTALPIAEFIKYRPDCALIDVRTPVEFAKGHIPTAVNVPLFNNEERAEIGTLYKQHNREAAILRGLDFVGPKMRSLVETTQRVSTQQSICLYCWRGGMRSQSVAWLLSTYGYHTYTLKNGYKAFRNYILEAFELPHHLLIISGKTGTGKTAILQALRQKRQQVVDLEALARHKGSAFGGIGQPEQPTQQQFENELGLTWRGLSVETPVWVEDESRYIGSRIIPQPIWRQMKAAPLIFVDMPLDLRVERLVQEYGQQDITSLVAAIDKIKKRLGGPQAQQAIAALHRGDLTTSCAILLEHYYDKAYLHSLSHKPPDCIRHVRVDSTDPVENAERVLQAL